MIRKLTVEDAQVMALLGEKTFRETFEEDNTSEDMNNYVKEAFSKKKMKEELKNKDSFTYLYAEDGEALAYMKLNLPPAQTEEGFDNSLELQRIYVLKKVKGKGIGKALLEEAINFARMMNLDYIWLGVWEHNRKAIDFYEKKGFKKFSEHTFLLGSDPQTDYLYRLDL